MYRTTCKCGEPLPAVSRAVAKPRQVMNQRDAYAVVRRRLARLQVEKLIGIYLDAQNGVVSVEVLSQGTLNTTRTHPREVLEPAIRGHALGMILAHNHPSGSLVVSEDDRQFTVAMRRAAELIGVDLHDHLIVSRNGFTSLKASGLM